MEAFWDVTREAMPEAGALVPKEAGDLNRYIYIYNRINKSKVSENCEEFEFWSEGVNVAMETSRIQDLGRLYMFGLINPLLSTTAGVVDACKRDSMVFEDRQNRVAAA